MAPSSGGDARRGGGHQLLVGGGGEDDQVDVGGVDAGFGERLGAGRGGELEEAFAGLGGAALFDPGPFEDPFGVDPELLGDLRVGDDRRGQRGADADHLGAAADQRRRGEGGGGEWLGQASARLLGDVEGAALDLLAEGAAGEAGEDVPGAGLEEGGGAGGVHRGERVAPAHRLGQRGEQVGADVVEGGGGDAGEGARRRRRTRSPSRISR